MKARISTLVVLSLALGLLAAVPARAEVIGDAAAEDNAAVLSPIVVTPLATPDPVLGSDGLVHVAYELFIVNQSSSPVSITSIDVVDDADPEQVLDTIDAATIGTTLGLTGGAQGTSFAPSASGYLFVDLEFDAGAKLPKQVAHTFDLTSGLVGGAEPAKTITVTGVPVRVSKQKAVVIAPPLKGSGWVAGNGCCSPPTAHRAATLSINGSVHVAERFAIDFVQLGPNGATAQGDPTKNESYGYFGDEIYAAASGKVVAMQDGQPEQTPGALPQGQTVQTAGGNFLVVDIGRGRYAFYAHLQPGSMKVKLGDAVKTGQVLALLGNTGNTDAAHLHFHIMDGPSPLLSNGLPFVFTRFEGEGVVTDVNALTHGQPAAVDTSADTGVHRKELPLNLEVLKFG